MRNHTKLKFAVLLAALVLSPAAMAQATRTWVSGVGDDANPCSRTAPCKTFAGAISKTATGGIINALDPAGYGGVTITKSITIDGGAGNLAGILASNTNGVIVNGAGIRVTLRNLSIEGVGTGFVGVSFLQGAVLTIENTRIFGFAAGNATGIRMTASGILHVKETDIHDANIGVHLESATGPVTATLDRVRISDTDSFGIQTANVNQVFVMVKGSTINGNAFNGIHAAGPGAIITVVDSSISFNGATGVNAAYPGAMIRLSNNTLVNNGNAIGIAAGATVASDGTNRIGGVSATPPNAGFTLQ